MPVDHIRYDILVQDALRGMVRDLLADTAKTGLAGEHHFYVTFDTTAEGVKLSDRLRERYPEEMTIVLQHQFWDMKVSDELFEVGLSFGGVAERLVIPLAAIKAFADPSVQFTLQFETLPEAGDAAEGDADAETPREAGKLQLKSESRSESRSLPQSQSQPAGKDAKPDARSKKEPGRTSVPASPLPSAASAETASAETASDKPGADQPADKSGGAEVVRLDRFRKK